MAFIPGRGLGDIVRHLEDGAEALARAKGAGMEVADGALAKLRWLEADGRDFRKVTLRLKKRMETAFVAELDKVLTGRAKPDAPAVAALKVYQDEVGKRLETGGGEVSMPALDPATVKRKGHSRVGDDSGELKRDWKRAKVRKVR